MKIAGMKITCWSSPPSQASARQPLLLRYEMEEIGLPSHSCEAAKAGAPGAESIFLYLSEIASVF
jgi:hypothetical protein